MPEQQWYDFVTAVEDAAEKAGRLDGERWARTFLREDPQRAREQADWLLQGLEFEDTETWGLIPKATGDIEAIVGGILRRVLGREWSQAESEAMIDGLSTYREYHCTGAREAMERAARARTDREPLQLLIRRADTGRN